MEELTSRSTVRFTVVSSVPGWFFTSFGALSLSRHELQTDVGLIQHPPLHEDIATTMVALKQFYALEGC